MSSLKPISKGRTKELKLRRLAVGEAVDRDNGCCVVCGSLAQDCHEIVPRSFSSVSGKNRDKLYELRNLVCLCRECHSKMANPAGRTRLLWLLAKRYGYTYPDQPWRYYLEAELPPAV
jgi:5-methylcytosine-specific restriction endonuclease McrA